MSERLALLQAATRMWPRPIILGIPHPHCSRRWHITLPSTKPSFMNDA